MRKIKLKTKFKLTKRKILNSTKQQFKCASLAKEMLLKHKHLINIDFSIKEFITSTTHGFTIYFKDIKHIRGVVFQNRNQKSANKQTQCIQLNCDVKLDAVACEQNNIPKEHADIDSVFHSEIKFKHNPNGFYCDWCKDRIYYKNKEELFYEHTLKGFTEWCNEKLQRNQKLVVHYDDGFSMAKIIEDNADYSSRLYTRKLDIFDD